MSLAEDLKKEVEAIFAERWSSRDGQKVPDPQNLRLGNDAVTLDGTVLYADLDGSTKLVDEKKPEFAAEIYKTYLHCAAKIIKAHKGVITAYDGDRIMAVYIGDSKNTSAVDTALKINYAVTKIINPAIEAQYGPVYTVKQVVGIDTSKLTVARIGVRGDNDLVWVGRAANYAAKLTTLPATHATWITKAVFDKMASSGRVTSKGESMWEARLWTTMSKMKIYRSNWRRVLS